jgi:hypothetical protein
VNASAGAARGPQARVAESPFQIIVANPTLMQAAPAPALPVGDPVDYRRTSPGAILCPIDLVEIDPRPRARLVGQ